jgi:urease accessory protein
VRQLREWASLDAQLHSQLAGNEPACRASVEQGRALVRVAGAWLHKVPAQRRLCASLLSHGRPHGATTLGALCAMLRLTPEAAAEAVAYTATRDVLSAAVRLNLIGPLAAVGMQADVAETAVGSALAAAALGVSHAASVAPLIEALHPCHDLLDRRIFRT